jgi:predicted phage terminase large subunit-like protein
MATQEKTIRLHKAQASFLRSSALFRAFVGGIGSGKSYAGAYDMIRKAKPNRLYLVCAPTYPMLSDASFRSFLAVAEELGIVNPEDVRRSSPPSIKLRTGAEVLFRTGDEPDRLRGPNLSGIWLDEASLMDEGVFNITIGRLREQGEQGWLTATFTPKGRTHWTYKQFATGRQDTEIFHARTADNPFLPDSFYSTVRQQYTSALAAQELEGEFVDLSGSMFKRHWFTIVAASPVNADRVRYWDKAATENDGDYSCGVRIAEADGIYYVEDVVRGQWGAGQRDRIIIQTAALDDRLGDCEIWTEQEPGSGGKESAENTIKLLAGYSIRAHKVTGDKVTRADPFAAQAEAGNVKIVAGAWNADWLDELCSFPEGKHDDQVDASAGAFSKLHLKLTLWGVH